MLTTRNSAARIHFRHNRLLQALAVIYLVIWLIAAFEPHYRFDWFLENLLVFAFVALLTLSYRWMPLSDCSYILITIFVSLHTAGSHYTYSETPAGFWMSDLFGFERNHYDRVVHFGFGLFLIYPVSEVIKKATQLSMTWTSLFSLTCIMAMSETYEIIEWLTAKIVDPEAALAYLGTQGDVFDAQKDSGLAAGGAVISLIAIHLLEHSRPTGERPLR